jgi:hypothetical protein
MLLLVALSGANAQAIDTTLQKLIDNQIVKKEDQKSFEVILKKSKQISGVPYLSSLFEMESSKYALQAHGKPYIIFGEEENSKREQKELNKRLLRSLGGLNKINLLSTKVFELLQARVSKSYYSHSLQFLFDLVNQAEKEVNMRPDKLMAFAKKLKSINIVVGKRYDSLLLAIGQGKIEYAIDFLNYSDKALIIKGYEYPEEPKSYLEPIHRSTMSVLPDLQFSNFNYVILLDSAESDLKNKYYNITISLRSNGKEYKHKSSYYSYDVAKKLYYDKQIDYQEYYQIFNKILADMQSPYRLHRVEWDHDGVIEWETFGIMALTKEQADSLHKGMSYIRPSYESFKNNLTSERISSAIEEYRKLGLLAHLTNSQIEQAKAQNLENRKNNLNEILQAFPGIIHTFDTELSNLDDPYAELVREYARISRHEFHPTEVSDDFDIEKNSKATVKFKLGDKQYQKQLTIEEDWMDGAFFDFIDDVVAENQLPGKFYQLYSGGQEASLIYLTEAQYNYLRQHQLLVFSDEWESQED